VDQAVAAVTLVAVLLHNGQVIRLMVAVEVLTMQERLN
jgi:hypothetical protein